MSCVETSPTVDDRATEDDDLVHVVCCVDPDLALCGTDVSAEPWSDAPIGCVVCEEIEANDTDPDTCNGCPLLARQEAA